MSDSDGVGELTLRSQLARFIESAAAEPSDATPQPAAGGIAFLDSLIQHAPEGIAVLTPGATDHPPKIVFVNDGFCRMTGMARNEVIGATPQIFRVAESDHAVMDALLHPLCQRKGFEGEAVAYRRNGARYALELLVVPIKSGSNELTHWVAYMRDVSERRAQLAALEHQALHDVLTDLPNRVLLRDRLEQAILKASAERSVLALITIDLDGFREINDEFGYHCGDLLLQQIGPRFRQLLNPADTVARVSGDEFAVLLPAVSDSREAMRIARRLHKSLEEAFVVQDKTVEVSGNLGVAMYPAHASDAAALMRCAESAMAAAKNSRSGYSMYSAEQQKPVSQSIAMKVDLREAIAQNQLVLYYQPKVHLRSGLVTRVEALVRWLHPERGLMLPDQFIPLAERTDLIKNLTDWVLDSALGQVRSWQDAGFPIHVAVNLSTHSLQEAFLPERVSALLEKWKIEPRMLKLEITESSILADPPHVLAILALLRTLGVRLSLDDFGTGYSSLMHLRHLPVDEIKIDKSFVMGMRSNKSDAAIVRATIDLAHALGYEVVAEGVDDEDTFRTLSSLGCDLAQGYYLSPPLPPDQLTKWLGSTQWGLSSTRTLRDGART